MSLGDKCVPKEQGCLSTMDSKILLPLPAPGRVYLSIYSLVLGVCCGVEDWRRSGTRRGMRLCPRHLQAVSRLRGQTSIAKCEDCVCANECVLGPTVVR